MRGTSRHYVEPELSREWNWKKQWLVYTGLFIVTALLVFAAFFVYQKTLLKGSGNVDGLMQHYPLLHQIEACFGARRRRLVLGRGTGRKLL